jgi:branched-chain amino acid transport system substrate-binding protein
MNEPIYSVIIADPSRLRRLREGSELRGGWRHVRLGLAVLCIMSLAGCALPGSSRTVLKVGLVAPFEGWYRSRGHDVLWAVRLAIREANDRGGVAGHRVELVALDDHLDPHWARQRARELAADPAVMGVVGYLSPTTAEAARSVHAAAGLPVVTLTSVEAEADGVFVLSPAPEALAGAAMDHIGSSPFGDQPRRVALLYSAQGASWADTLGSQGGTVVRVAADRPGWLEALFEGHVDWVICTADTQLGGHVLRQARDQGLEVTFIGGPDWDTDAFRQVAGDAAAGNWLVTGVPRGDSLAEARRFRLDYQQLGGHSPGSDAVLAYDATRLLLAALEEAIEHHPCPDRQTVKETLGSVSLEGLTGPIRFGQEGARADAPVWVYRTD